MGCTNGESMGTIVGRAKVLGIVFALLLCLAVPLSLAQNAKAEPVEYRSSLKALPESRMYPNVVEDGGKLYIIGGFVSDISGSTLSLTTVVIYDIASGEVTYGADLPTGVVLSAITKGVDGRIYVFGGYNRTMGYTTLTQIYNITSNSWSPGTPSPVTFGSGSAISVANGTIYVIGANQFSGNSTLAYDPVGDSWKYTTDQPVNVWARMAVYWNETTIYVMGGYAGSGASDSTYSFNPVTGAWTALASMPNRALFGGAATGLNGVVYCFGGVDGSWVNTGPQVSAIQKYDPASDTWSVSTISTFTPARSGFGYSIDKFGRIFAVGGYDGSSVVTTVTMIVPTDLVLDELQIVGPTDGGIVSGKVTISVAFKTPDVGMPVIDVFVDGVFLDSQTAPPFGGTVSYVWDASGLTDGSTHVIMARGTLWNGAMREDSVTVTVSSLSVEQQIAAIQTQLASLQAQLNIPGANLTALAIQAAILQAKLDGIIAGSTATSDAMNVTFANLQAQLDAFQKQIDRVENKADNAGTYAIVNLVLVIIVIVLVAMMLMMVRKKQ